MDEHRHLSLVPAAPDPAAELASCLQAISRASARAAELIPEIVARGERHAQRNSAEWTIEDVMQTYNVGRSWIYERLDRIRSHKRGKYRRFVPAEVEADIAALAQTQSRPLPARPRTTRQQPPAGSRASA